MSEAAPPSGADSPSELLAAYGAVLRAGFPVIEEPRPDMVRLMLILAHCPGGNGGGATQPYGGKGRVLAPSGIARSSLAAAFRRLPGALGLR